MGPRRRGVVPINVESEPEKSSIGWLVQWIRELKAETIAYVAYRPKTLCPDIVRIRLVVLVGPR